MNDLKTALEEDLRRSANEFGLTCTAAELDDAYHNLRGKNLPRQLAELAIRVGRLEKLLKDAR
jgi:hypothetical protein